MIENQLVFSEESKNLIPQENKSTKKVPGSKQLKDNRQMNVITLVGSCPFRDFNSSTNN